MSYLLLLLPILIVPVASVVVNLPNFDFDISGDNDFYCSIVEELEGR